MFNFLKKPAIGLTLLMGISSQAFAINLGAEITTDMQDFFEVVSSDIDFDNDGNVDILLLRTNDFFGAAVSIKYSNGGGDLSM